MKRALKKIAAMVALMVVAVAVLGGVGYLLWCGAWVPAMALVVLTSFAWPTIRKIWDYWWKG